MTTKTIEMRKNEILAKIHKENRKEAIIAKLTDMYTKRDEMYVKLALGAAELTRRANEYRDNTYYTKAAAKKDSAEIVELYDAIGNMVVTYNKLSEKLDDIRSSKAYRCLGLDKVIHHETEDFATSLSRSFDVNLAQFNARLALSFKLITPKQKAYLWTEFKCRRRLAKGEEW